MSSPAVLDFEVLLAPIPGDRPTGADVREDASPTSTYFQVKDARSAARAAERQVVLEGDDTAAPGDWKPVLQQGTRLLAEQAKDLEVVAYLIEALIRLHGFAGLRDGFRLARELVERYWDDLYPRPDEEGLATRVGHLTGLNGDDGEGTLIRPIARAPLTEAGGDGPYSFAHYQQAQALAGLEDEKARARRVERGAVTMEQFNGAVAASSAAFFVTLVEDITGCADEFGQLSARLDERCGEQAPPSSNIRSALASCLEAVQFFARDKLALGARAAEATAAAEEAPAAPGSVAPAAAPPPGTVLTREDAFEAIVKIAEFFRRTEPHSPVSYALEQVVRWGRLPLPQLLLELVPDRAPREFMTKLTGIPNQEP